MPFFSISACSTSGARNCLLTVPWKKQLIQFFVPCALWTPHSSTLSSLRLDYCLLLIYSKRNYRINIFISLIFKTRVQMYDWILLFNFFTLWIGIRPVDKNVCIITYKFEIFWRHQCCSAKGEWRLKFQTLSDFL